MRTLSSPLAKARGLGSAKTGTHHFWMQRVTAVALIPLTVWFVICAIGLKGADIWEFELFLAAPVNTALMILFVVMLAYHGQQGIQVVVEDYVSSKGAKLVLLLLNTFLAAVLAVLGTVSVLRVAFGG